MKNKRFLKNAALLTLTGLFLRGLGMLLRVYISARIGEEGMGVYQLITSAYFLFITLAQAGVGVIITRLCARRFALSDNAAAYNIMKNGALLAMLSGTVAAILMFALSKPICTFWIADARALLSLRTLAFSLPFIALCSVLQAYFMAMKNVTAGCSAQILEQLTRMTAVVVFSSFFARLGLDKMLAALFLANTLSEGVSCIYLSLKVIFAKRRPVGGETVRKRRIFTMAMPVAASRLLSSALRTSENMLVPSAAAVFCGSRADALSAFGALKGMAVPLMFFPFSFLSALSSLLVPEIAGAHARADGEGVSRTVNRTCFITVILSVMTAGVFFLFADSFGMLVYKSETVSDMLRILSPVLPCMYLDTVCDGMIKALGGQGKMFLNNCIDSALRILLVIIVVPRFGIYGFAGVMFFSNILICTLNLLTLKRISNIKLRLFRPVLLSVAVVCLSAIITKIFVPNGATFTKTALGCTLFCLIYLTLTQVFGAILKVYKNN